MAGERGERRERARASKAWASVPEEESVALRSAAAAGGCAKGPLLLLPARAKARLMDATEKEGREEGARQRAARERRPRLGLRCGTTAGAPLPQTLALRAAAALAVLAAAAMGGCGSCQASQTNQKGTAADRCKRARGRRYTDCRAKESKRGGAA